VANIIRDFILVFCSILYEAMPFVILGVTIAGILEVMSPKRAFAFMSAVSVFLLTVLFVPLPLDSRIPLSFVLSVGAFLVLLRCGRLIAWTLLFLGRHRILAIGMSGMLGLVMPMCECGIIPVMRRLLRKGMPLSCCVCYLLAGPIINIVVLLSTYVAFAGMEHAVDPSGKPAFQAGGIAMMLLRGGLGWLIAFTTALIIERQHRIYGDELLTPLARPPAAAASALAGQPTAIQAASPVGIQKSLPVLARSAASGASTAAVEQTALQDEPSDSVGHPLPMVEAPSNNETSLVEEGDSKEPILGQLGRISETALHDFIDITVFLILGALLSALARALIPPHIADDISRSQPAIAIGAMMVLAILLCLCSEADAFIAASFTMLRPSAKLAFVVFGPMLDLKLYMMYLRVFRPRLIWTIIPSVIIQTFVYSLIFHYLWEAFAPMFSSHFTVPAAP
jgi:uncharacterized protein